MAKQRKKASDKRKLSAGEQKLEATIQQLRASEQQLKAANQQLQASEQQLRAANQQLRANGQQLKAANQQLQASEQQLKAANQQLEAANQQLRASQEEVRALAKFPSENPNPVLRIGKDGIIIYANEASPQVLQTWGCKEGQRLPDDCYKRVEEVVNLGETADFEFTCQNGRIFSVTLAYVVNADYVNAYGLDITERKQAEEKLLDYQEQLKQLASQLTLAEESERHRIATELHATIGQSLVVSKLQLDTLRASAPSAEIAKKLGEVCETLNETIQGMRSLTFDLSSPILYELGFEKAVAEWLIERIQQKHDIATEFEDDGQPKPLDEDIRVFLFRDVRELLLNVIKHARAKKVKVSVRRVGRQIHVGVEDDGWGFDPAKVRATAVRKGGFGLFSIRERLEQIGGELEIDSAPGHGTKVTLVAPLKQDQINDGG